jgi:hypothetical protein
MHMLWAVTKTEIRLAWRKRSFWMVQGLILLWGFKLGMAAVAERIVLGFVSDEIFSLLSAELLLLPILVGPAVARDLGVPGDLLWTTPLDALTHAVGVTGGLWLALLPALVFQVGTRWLIGYMVYGVQAPLFWTYGLPPLLISVGAGLGLVVLLATILRRTLPLLLVWAALSTSILVWAKMTSPLNLGFSRLQLSPALGLGLYRSLVHSLSAWWVAVGLMAVPLTVYMALVADGRRAVRRRVQLWPWVLLAGVAMASGYLWHSRSVAAQTWPASPVDVQLDAWIVRAHSLQATVDAVRSTIDGTSTLVLEPTDTKIGEDVVLRLNPGLALREVHNEAGRPLAATRRGESVIITFATLPTRTFTLHLSWEGTLRLFHTDYASSWAETSQPVRSFLTDGVGYLLREGDWYPWPWSTGQRQAEKNHVTLQVTDERALSPAPLRDGTVIWEGEMPPALLVIPPADEYAVDDVTLHVGHSPILAGPHLLERLRSFAPAALTLARALGEGDPVAHIIACPYLTEFVWSGDLLLVPEGTGSLDWDEVALAYWRGPTPGAEERAALTVLARAWLEAHVPPPRYLRRVVPNQASWRLDDPVGRWVEADELVVVGSAPTYAGQSPPRWRPGPTDQLNTLALWIALELADPTVRDTDLELFQQMASLQKRTSQNEVSQLYSSLQDRLLPLGSDPGREQRSVLLPALHDWATAVGPERALRLVGDVVPAVGSFDLEQLLAEMEQASGVAIERSTDR